MVVVRVLAGVRRRYRGASIGSNCYFGVKSRRIRLRQEKWIVPERTDLRCLRLERWIGLERRDLR